MFKDRTIEKRVGAILRERIDTAQAEFDQKREAIEEERQDEHNAVDDRHDARVSDAATTIASKVFSPLN